MVAGETPDWLPPGFTVKTKYKSGRKLKYYLNDATGRKYNSKNEVIRCAAEYNSSLPVTPRTKNATKNADGDGPSSLDKVDLISGKTNDLAWLPSGWTVEEKRRKGGSSAGITYKVYTELLTRSKFYSKVSVIRYLSDVSRTDILSEQNKIDNVDELLPDMSLQISPATNTGSISEKKRKANSLVTVCAIDNVEETVPEKSPQLSMTSTDGTHEQGTMGNSHEKIDNVDEPIPDMSPPVISTTNTDGIRKKKRKSSSFVTVSVERTTADDLPSGWIKEIRTSKSGSKMRKDPFYTDPVSGYMFRSKPDALRYLKTNDIGSCSCKPLKKELDDIKSVEIRNPSPTPANHNLPTHERQPFLGEESNGGRASSCTKSPAELKSKTVKRNQVNHDSARVTAVGAISLEDKVSCGNSNKIAEMGNGAEPESEVSDKNATVMAVDVAMSPPVTDPSESGGRNKGGSRKSKKKREASTPMRTSKRLAGSEPELQPNLDLNERSLRAAVRGSTPKEADASPIPLEASDIPQTSNIEPAKETVEHVIVVEEARQDVNEPKEVGKPPIEGSAIPEEQSCTTETAAATAKAKAAVTETAAAAATASNNPLVDGQQSQVSQLCYDFGDSWSDPLEFALRTLRGELPIEDTLKFPGCFQEPLGTTFGQADGCLKQSQFDAPVNFQSEFASQSEPSKKQNAVDQPPAIPPSFSALGNIGFNSCGGFNFQPSTEVGKKDSQTKFNP